MKKRFLALLTVGVVFAACNASLPEDPPNTVESVDLERYAGLWYEVARLPVFYQDDDEMAKAEYSLNDEGTIDVVNTAIHADGSSQKVTGTAEPVPGSNNAKLRVSIDNFFARLFGSPPDYGNYWVLKLDSDYRMALVGTPDRDALWLLSRTPTMEKDDLKEYIDYAESQGYDTSRLIINNG